MKNKKLYAVIEALALIVLGVLIAAFGGQSVIDTYFAIVLVAGGAFVLALCIYDLAKTKVMLFAPLFLGVAALLIGIFILAKYYSFGYFLYTLILLIIAGGIALIFYGIYTISKKATLYGVIQIIVGSVVATLGFLYIFVAKFQSAFWIVAGIVLALYGVFYLVETLFDKRRK